MDESTSIPGQNHLLDALPGYECQRLQPFLTPAELIHARTMAVDVQRAGD